MKSLFNVSPMLPLMACLVLLAIPASAQQTHSLEPNASLMEDAASYAELQGVSLRTAVQRLEIQREVGALDEELGRDLRGSFAGLWIQHEPDFRVVVRFTEDSDPAALQARFSTEGLAPWIEFQTAQRSLAELEAAQAAFHHLGAAVGVPFDSEINVVENRVDVFVTEAEGLLSNLDSAGIGLPTGVKVVSVPSLLQTEQAILNGGESLSTCTAGFTVRHNGTGELGVSTAAHCGNAQNALFTALPFRAQDISGNQDVQWHSACDLFDVSNNFNSGIGLRATTGTQHRNSQAVGSFVCKWGRTTGRTCGFIASTSVLPSTSVTNRQATFVRVDGPNGADLSDGGDSGGPWFVEGLAYGIHHGGYNSGTLEGDAVYMPINYISSLGVSVLTFDPGNCNLWPTASFTWSRVGSTFTVNFDASASLDPDGTINTYVWDFGDGTGSFSVNPTMSHTYSTEGTYIVTLTVTDNEGATRSDTGTVSFCSTGAGFPLGGGCLGGVGGF